MLFDCQSTDLQDFDLLEKLSGRRDCSPSAVESLYMIAMCGAV